MLSVSSVVTALLVAVACCTIFELWSKRAYLFLDELRDEERGLAWRVVLFLITPLVVLLDLRVTIIATEWAGGWVQDWAYSLWWYNAVPRELPSPDLLVPVLFAGVVAQVLLCLCLLPALLFRPHPFVAVLISYTVALTLGMNLVAEPVLSIVGAGGSRWEIFLSSADRDTVLPVLGVYAASSLLFFLCVSNRSFRLRLAELTRPVMAEQLRIALSEAKAEPESSYHSCRLAILLERTGLRRQASTELLRIRKSEPGSLYALFLEGFLEYRRRRYRRATSAFEKAAAILHLDDSLRASFLAAAACSAYADGRLEPALNFACRALEFDNLCALARLVKVDVFLRQGKKQQAGEEVLSAIRQGLSLESAEKVPIDTDAVMRGLLRLERKSSETRELAVSSLGRGADATDNSVGRS